MSGSDFYNLNTGAAQGAEGADASPTPPVPPTPPPVSPTPNYAPTPEGGRYVLTPDAERAVLSNETQLVTALGLGAAIGNRHITCPLNRGHVDRDESFRWDEHKRCAFCTCISTLR